MDVVGAVVESVCGLLDFRRRGLFHLPMRQHTIWLSWGMELALGLVSFAGEESWLHGEMAWIGKWREEAIL